MSANADDGSRRPSYAQAADRSESYRNVGPDQYQEDVDYDAEVASLTDSLVSAAVNYKLLHGRRYQTYREGAYLYPNDEQERERLDLTHKMIEFAMDGKLHFSPLENPKNVLDIGTGTGIWSIEFGEQNPETNITGNDLSPIQPLWTPPNVHFEVDDVEEPWKHAENFDFIHSRCMGSAIRDWPKLTQQVFEFLTPGGYAEFIDFDVEYISPDDTLEEGSFVHQSNKLYIDSCRNAGIEPCPGIFLQDWMAQAGFETVTAARRYLPIGTWPEAQHLKEVGAWNFMMVDQGLEGFLYYLYAQILGMSKEETDDTCASIRKQLRDPKVHCMYTLWVCYGRKPFGSGNEHKEETSQLINASKEDS